MWETVPGLAEPRQHVRRLPRRRRRGTFGNTAHGLWIGGRNLAVFAVLLILGFLFAAWLFFATFGSWGPSVADHIHEITPTPTTQP